jgi:phosphoribosylformimino-5-aminoimidazole carboxamide ribotide isomerase
MNIIPAIDIRRGKCVRLIQGDIRDEIVYSNEPLEMAKLWIGKGAKWIHIVDIDGALVGKPKNMDIIIKIIKTVKVNVEVGGGLRTEADIKKYIRAGAKRVILSTSAILSDEFLDDMVKKYREKLIIGVDAKNGYIAIKGWQDITQVKMLDFINKLEKKQIKRIIFTDIKRDGVLKGPNFESIMTVLKNTNMKVIVSGGVSRMKNIKKLLEYEKKYKNLEGIVIGQALYKGTLDLKEVLKLVRD